MTTLAEAQKKIEELEAEVKELDDECEMLDKKLVKREKTLEITKKQLNESTAKVKELEQYAKNQERKWGKYHQLEEEKKKIEQQLEQLQNKENVSKGHSSQESPDAVVSAEISKLEGELAKRDKKIAKYKKELEEMEEELVQLKEKDGQTESLTSQLNFLKGGNNRQEASSDLTELLEKNSKLEEQNQKLSSQLQKLETNLQSSTSEKPRNDEINALQMEIAKKDKKLAKYKNEIESMNEELAQLDAKDDEIDDLTAKLKKMKKEIELLEKNGVTSVSKLEKEILNRDKNLEEYQKQVESLNQELNSVESKNQEIETLTSEVSNLKKELEQHSTNQRAVSSESQLKCEELIQMNAQLENHNEELSSQIQQLQKHLKTSKSLAVDRGQEVDSLKGEINKLEVEASFKNNQIERYKKERTAMMDDLSELDRKREEIVKVELELKLCQAKLEDLNGKEDGTVGNDERYDELLRQYSDLQSTNEKLASQIQLITLEKEQIENRCLDTQTNLEAHISILQLKLSGEDTAPEKSNLEDKLKTKDFEIEKLLNQVNHFEQEIDNYRASESSADYLRRKQEELFQVNTELDASNQHLAAQIEKLKLEKKKCEDKFEEKEKEMEKEISHLNSEIFMMQNKESTTELVSNHNESLLDCKNQEIEALTTELVSLKKEIKFLNSNQNSSNSELTSENEKLSRQLRSMQEEKENQFSEKKILSMQNSLDEERKLNRELTESESYKNELLEMKDGRIQSLESRIKLMTQKIETFETDENNTRSQSNLDEVSKRSSQLEFKNEELLAEIQMLKIDLDMARRKVLTEDQNDVSFKISELEAEILKRDKELEEAKQEKNSLKDLLELLESKDKKLNQLMTDVNDLEQENENVRRSAATGLMIIPEDGNREELVSEINYLTQQLEEAAGTVEVYEKQIREMKSEIEELKTGEKGNKTNLIPEVEVVLQSRENPSLESAPSMNFPSDTENTRLNEEIAVLKDHIAQLQSQSQAANSLRLNCTTTSVSEENDELKSRVAMLAAANEGLKHEIKMMRENDDCVPMNTSSNSNSGNENGAAASTFNHASVISDLQTEKQSLQTELSNAEINIGQLKRQISDLEKDLSWKQSKIQELKKDRNSKMSLTNENIGLKIEIPHLKNELSVQESVCEKLELEFGICNGFSAPSLPFHVDIPWRKMPETSPPEPKIGFKNKRESLITGTRDSYDTNLSPSFDHSVQQLLTTISKKPPKPVSYNSPPILPSSSSKIPLPSGGIRKPKTFSHSSPILSQKPGKPQQISPLKTKRDIPNEYNRQIDEFSRSTHALLQSMSNLEARLQRKDSDIRNLSSTINNSS